MNLAFNFIKSISNIFDEMHRNGFSLVYFGELNHEITRTFTKMTEDDLERKNEDRMVTKKVFHVMVETIQNMTKHSDDIRGNVGQGLLVLGKKEDRYYVITSNKVSAAHKGNLEAALEEVNAASPQKLKEMYKQQMIVGAITEKGGAGLGLIDIARKTEQKLEYQFLPIDDDSYFFILKVEILAEKGA